MSDSTTQIANLVGRYAEYIDAGDFEGVAALLADAAVGSGDAGDGDSSATLTGRQQVLRLYEGTTRRYEDGTPRTKHMTTNLIIEVDEEAGTATARSYWMVFQAVPGLPLQPILAGRYHDTFDRAPGTWRFTGRRFLVDLVGDLSHHLLTELPS